MTGTLGHDSQADQLGDIGHFMSKSVIAAFLKTRAQSAQRPLGLSIALSFTSGLLLIVQMGLLAHTITKVLTEGTSLSGLTGPLFALPVLFSLRAILSYLSERLALHAAIDLQWALRSELFSALLARGPVRSGDSEETTGDAVTMLTEGVDALEGYFARYLPAMVMMVLLPFAILIVTLGLDWVSAVVMVVTAPLIPVFMILIGKGTERLNQKQWRKLARLSAHFLDVIQGLTTLKMFNASRREAETVSRMADDYRRTTMGVLRVAFLSSLALEFFATLSIAIIAVFIGFRLLYGDMGFYSGLFVLLLAPDFYLPLRQMGTHYHARLEAIGAAEAMADLMQDRAAVSTDKSQHASLNDLGRIEIEFRDVSYSYPDGNLALSKLSFHLPAGAKLAIVGHSGAGKSTLMDLLLGLITPDEGEIRINGVALSDWNLQAWRQHLSYVPQRPTLFAETIHDVIAYGAPQTSRNAVIAAATAAHAHDFVVKLENGYDHRLIEGGANLSGGQIQRLAVARALLRHAPLLLLDEPSAHLDQNSESEVQAAFDAINPKTTTITIAHRLNTIKNADTILVLDKGRLIETGTHDGLMQLNGAYAELVSVDFLEKGLCA